jgi:hypothetical protein
MKLQVTENLSETISHVMHHDAVSANKFPHLYSFLTIQFSEIFRDSFINTYDLVNIILYLVI